MNLRRNNRQFIEIVPIDFHGSVGTLPKEDYFAIPANIAWEMGYETSIVAVPESLKGIIDIKAKSNINKKIKIITCHSWTRYIMQLWKNRQSIIFSNDRTAKSFVACFFGKKNIFMSHQSRNPPIWWQRQIFKFFVKRFDAIKVSNPFEVEELVKLGVKREKIHYIPLSIDYRFFGIESNQKARSSTQKKYKIKKNEKVFLFLANIRKFKRVDTALRAMKILKDKNVKFKFIVVGSDLLKEEKEKSISNMAKELKLENHVIITGWLKPEEARDIMNISDICINSSIHEGQCLVVYEAAAADIPLCVSNIGSFTSVFTYSALFHDPDDAQKLAENIEYYIEHPQTAQKHVIINQKIVKDRCDYKVVSQQLKKLFEYKTK